MARDRPFGFFDWLFVFVGRLFLVACVLIAVFAIVGFSVGWIKFERNAHNKTATIKIDAGKVEHAAESTVEKGKELVGTARDKITGREHEKTPPADRTARPEHEGPERR